ncbi:hypothetical protein, partial [uncultured Maribacter sp.]|uniref:hypothetical protein n=1 Tax=uncultured Maribacter sp. TaxID=431308 RepID=UPI0030EE5D60
TDTQLAKTDIEGMGFVDGAHTIDTDTQLAKTDIETMGFVDGAHTVDTDTHADQTEIEGLGFVTGAHTIDTDTQLAKTDIETMGFVDGAHTIDTDTQYTAGTGLTLSTTIFSVNNLAGDVTGPINATIIADGAISGGSGGKIVDNSITESDLAPNSVNSSEINLNAVETENILNGNVTPIKIQPGSNNQVLTTNSSGTVVWENQSANVTTNLNQNTTTGLITYTNETNTDQTANTVGAETTNQISVATNGGAYYESPIKAFGKIGSVGTVTKATAGVTATRISKGRYRVTLPTGAVSDANYIIQLTQPGRGGVGNDDPGISYSNQTATSFEVIIGDNDNGGTDRSRFDSEFMFTILDL